MDRVCNMTLQSEADMQRRLQTARVYQMTDDPGVKPTRHVFVAHKAPWHEIADDLPQFPELPPKAKAAK